MINIPHLLLAAGTSKRMGEPKQLLNWGNKKLIQFQIERILLTTEKLFIILGAHADIIEPYIKSSSTPEIKLHCDEKDKFQILSIIINEIRTTYTNEVDIIDIDGVRVESKDFWFLIRASNTQNCLVFRLEHFNKDNFKKEINKLIKFLKNYNLDISELTNFNNTI